MPTIVVTSDEAGAGKTGVAAVLARHSAYSGVPTKLVRLPGDERAEADAAWFGSLDFVPGSATVPGDASAAPSGECVVIEAPAGTSPDIEGATVVSVSKSDAGLAVSIGGGDAMTIANDQTLAGFDIEDVQRILAAQVLVEGDVSDVTCDHLVIAPIGSDAGEPYFRRFPSFACVVRFDRTDMHLAAIKGGAAFLVLTGGRRPMDYLFDVTSAEGVPVLVGMNDTENTVIALEAVFDKTRFHGPRKLERMVEVASAAGFFDAVDAATSVTA
jgi:hypothetical protein